MQFVVAAAIANMAGRSTGARNVGALHCAIMGGKRAGAKIAVAQVFVSTGGTNIDARNARNELNKYC